MSKYEALNIYLKGQTRQHIPMTFAQIERIVGTPLPQSKFNRAWWSNNRSNNVMTKFWLSAGYKTESVDIAGEKLVFRKMDNTGKPPHAGNKPNSRAVSLKGGRKSRPGYYGSLKGTLKLDVSIDLTEPANPDWAKVYEDG